ncbi:uncharacterized protein FIBRA_03485 [Fibroporia radiculosa]|uniref:Uncharacterized protein n=1 Tax=Fibroporia radiculosa TaxID=599839 RepID=J4G5M7_9APHY|nr:uncharacterized protein FIBRA_03485 [Fibroporia radiculosa]CCM01433.1 predicted protein [Fibroporia radiculosa]
MNGESTTTTATMVVSLDSHLAAAAKKHLRINVGSEPEHAQKERPLNPHTEGDLHATSGKPRLPASQNDADNNTDSDGDAKMRPRHMTIELPSEPIEVLYDPKLSIEDHSPKPCIVPGNALHLIDDDPSPRSQTPSSVIIISDANDLATMSPHEQQSGTDCERSSSEPPPAVRPAPRVRFRSRVRITSGMHRHRTANGNGNGNGNGCAPSGTPSSSSSSPSSSISAPLRYHADENALWGPLGRRLSAYAGQKRVLVSPRPPDSGVGDARRRNGSSRQLNERTPLMKSSRRPTYVDTDDEGSRLREGDEEEYEEELRAAALRREEEAVFGPWPRRLLNRHWWWWHLEPVLCCTYCSEDFDYDE